MPIITYMYNRYSLSLSIPLFTPISYHLFSLYPFIPIILFYFSTYPSNPSISSSVIHLMHTSHIHQIHCFMPVPHTLPYAWQPSLPIKPVHLILCHPSHAYIPYPSNPLFHACASYSPICMAAFITHQTIRQTHFLTLRLSHIHYPFPHHLS